MLGESVALAGRIASRLWRHDPTVVKRQDL